MKLHKPLFSTILILIQLILSLINHYEHIEAIKKMKEVNPDLFELISYRTTYDSLFFFVLIIGFYEMLTKPNWFKTVIRIFLVCIILGTQFSGFVPIEDFYYGVYNTAWFSSVVALFLILFQIGKYLIGKITHRKLNKTE